MSLHLRRTIALGLLALLVGGAALGAVADAACAQAAKRYPARLLVYAQEWSLTPSRRAVPAGKVTVQLWNRGDTDHDLRIRHITAGGTMYGPVDGAVRITSPGVISTATWTLKAGRYQMYCSLPGHLAMGMHVLLRVTAA